MAADLRVRCKGGACRLRDLRLSGHLFRWPIGDGGAIPTARPHVLRAHFGVRTRLRPQRVPGRLQGGWNDSWPLRRGRKSTVSWFSSDVKGQDQKLSRRHSVDQPVSKRNGWVPPHGTGPCMGSLWSKKARRWRSRAHFDYTTPYVRRRRQSGWAHPRPVRLTVSTASSGIPRQLVRQVEYD